MITFGAYGTDHVHIDRSRYPVNRMSDNSSPTSTLQAMSDYQPPNCVSIDLVFTTRNARHYPRRKCCSILVRVSLKQTYLLRAIRLLLFPLTSCILQIPYNGYPFLRSTTSLTMKTFPASCHIRWTHSWPFYSSALPRIVSSDRCISFLRGYRSEETSDLGFPVTCESSTVLGLRFDDQRTGHKAQLLF